jgi:hypothetical protein
MKLMTSASDGGSTLPTNLQLLVESLQDPLLLLFVIKILTSLFYCSNKNE